MPNFTTKYQFPSPKPNESADGPTGFQQLAQKIEDVLFAQFGKAYVGNTPEISFVGSGTSAADPFKASLLGVRNGNWNVTGTGAVTGLLTANAGVNAPGGSIQAQNGYVYAGKVGGTGTYMFRALQRYNNFEYEARYYVTAGAAIVALTRDGSLIHYLTVDNDGDISHTSGGQTRPLPFASYVGNVSVSHTSDIILNSSLNFPTGRFTVTPNVVACCYDTSSFCLGVLTTTDKNGADFQTRYHLNTTTSNSFGLRVHAVQMTGAAAIGRDAPPPVSRTGEMTYVENVATCRVSGCENEDVAVQRYRPDDAVIWCGVCGQQVTDIVAV